MLRCKIFLQEMDARRGTDSKTVTPGVTYNVD